jgi:hypothetical protein
MSTLIILQSFFSDKIDYIDVNFRLIERNQSTLWIAMIGLGISFALLALSKIGTNSLLSIFFKIIFKNNSILKIINEEYALTNFSSFILFLNFILTTSLLTYLSFLHVQIDINNKLIYFLPLFPIYIFLWPLLWFHLIGIVSKESKVFNENKKNAIVLSQITGFIFSFLLLIWTFNLRFSNLFMIVFILIVLLLWLFKIFRGIIFSFQHGVAWYYIILYFCTLEILPLILFLNIIIW